MNELMLFHDQLLATKFFVPSSSHSLIARPQLTILLNQGLRRKLTLIAAPAGFGKTTLLSTWVQSLPPGAAQVAWPNAMPANTIAEPARPKIFVLKFDI